MNEQPGDTLARLAPAAPAARSGSTARAGAAAAGLAVVSELSSRWWGRGPVSFVPGDDGAWSGAIGFGNVDPLAVVGALLALALVQPWGRGFPRRGRPAGMRLLMKSAGTLHRSLYRWSGGRVGGRLRGCPVLLLTTTGRRTGRERTWPLCYVAAGDDLVLVASAGGEPRHPAWYLNLRANPRVGVQLGDGPRTMVARTAEGIERGRLWERVVHRFPVAAGYQRRTSRQIPVVILRPAAAAAEQPAGAC